MGSWKPGRDEAKQLKKAGYDGLYFPGQCACKVDDLYPCGERHDECKPGIVVPCPNDADEGCELDAAGDDHWHIGPREAK